MPSSGGRGGGYRRQCLMRVLNTLKGDRPGLEDDATASGLSALPSLSPSESIAIGLLGEPIGPVAILSLFFSANSSACGTNGRYCACARTGN